MKYTVFMDTQARWSNVFKSNNKRVWIIILGIACSVLLVTSQALTTDFIGDKTHQGAFTFGLMSFADKVSNGAVVMGVQSL